MPTIVSRKYNFLFVHIYKVAGTSVASALGKYEEWHEVKTVLRTIWRYAPRRFIPISTSLDTYPLRDHARASQLKSSISDFERLYKFAFVRNPWDWQVSLYHFMKSRPLRPKHKLISRMAFDEYIEWRTTHDRVLQKEIIYDPDGRCLVDFVGKYENLNADFATICRNIGIKVALPSLKVSKNRKPYQSYYGEKTRDLVSKAYAEDIDTFDYQF